MGLTPGTQVGYELTVSSDSAAGLVRQTNLTVGDTTRFIRNDGTDVPAVEVWSDTPAFWSYGALVGSRAERYGPEHVRPKTLYLFETERPSFLALRPDGPRSPEQLFARAVRAYYYPLPQVAPGGLPPVDPALFVGMVPLHLGLADGTFATRDGTITQSVSAVDDGLVVDLKITAPLGPLNATLFFDGAPFPLYGTVEHRKAYDEGRRLTWTFNRTSFVAGTGTPVALGREPFGPPPPPHGLLPLTTTPILPGIVDVLHPPAEAFPPELEHFVEAVKTSYNHPQAAPFLIRDAQLLLADWQRYPVAPYYDESGRPVPDTSWEQWRFELYHEDMAAEPRQHMIAGVHVQPIQDLKAVAPFPLTHAVSLTPQKGDLPMESKVGPTMTAFDRFITAHGLGTDVDRVAWRAWPAAQGHGASLYWTVSTGCDWRTTTPPTVVMVDATTLQAAYAFYQEDYEGLSKCSIGAIPPIL